MEEEKNIKYVIIRDDRKITGEELSLEEAKLELERWQKILKRWPDGTSVKIEQVVK